MNPDTFLKQEIEASSPAKLRFLLIRKAIGLCETVEGMWRASEWQQANQWSLRIVDILTELLAGVTDRANVAAVAISDLYVYLNKMMLAADQSHDLEALGIVKSILEIELETWRLYVSQEIAATHSGAVRGGSFQAAGDPISEEPTRGFFNATAAGDRPEKAASALPKSMMPRSASQGPHFSGSTHESPANVSLNLEA